MSNETEIPRRNQINRWTAAERAIAAAVQETEAVGADVRLTDAVVLLGEARQAVADYVDGVVGPRWSVVILVATGACVYLRRELFPKRETGK